MKHGVLVLMFAVAIMPVQSQAPGQRPSFEVASIKRNTFGGQPRFIGCYQGQIRGNEHIAQDPCPLRL
jgi:hypothetical protein